MYQIETAKMFLQTIPTTVNDRRRTYTTVNERKTQQNPKKPKQTMLSKTGQGEAKASICKQKPPFATRCQPTIYRTAPGFVGSLLSYINQQSTTN